MTKTNPKQLELPVMVDVNVNLTQTTTSSKQPEANSTCEIDIGFHRPASTDDNSIYLAIRDNYFKTPVKQA
jgi:hypothetical protein